MYVLVIFRIEGWNSICNVVLTLNGSDYEMVEKLEDEDAIPGLEIKNLKTKNGNPQMERWKIDSLIRERTCNSNSRGDEYAIEKTE
jgi:hypothetical protein